METAMTWDILIRRGTLIDGSGGPGTIGDIALLAGRIAALGPSLAGTANKVIDADGLAVTPGFIDIKTHSDFVLPINPKAESKVRQGVTTEIIGHCGFSVAPVLPGKVQVLADYLSGAAMCARHSEEKGARVLDRPWSATTMTLTGAPSKRSSRSRAASRTVRVSRLRQRLEDKAICRESEVA
jgi:N-acyl-D-aspartate/D-glutamate deacylase